MRLSTTNTVRRSGFTLVELIVVMSLMVLLAAMTVGIANSSIVDSYKIVGAGDRVSGWLIMAKNKAQREGHPRGVRFFVGSTGQITEAQYIEVPDPYTPTATGNDVPRILFIQNPSGARSATLQGAGVIAAVQANVSQGDTLYLPEFNLLLPLTGSVPANGQLPVDTNKLPDLSLGRLHVTTAFGFHRAPRPMLGEPILLLPSNMVIDVRDFAGPSGSSTSILPQVNGEFDVLFAPNGEVVNTGTLGQIIFWIRNTNFLPESTNPRTNLGGAGEMILVVVYPKTGAVSTQPVLSPAANPDPYGAAKDGVNSGL